MANEHSGESIVRPLLERGERVRFVEALVNPDLLKGPVAVKIQLETAAICVAARADDDTVAISGEWPAEHDGDAAAEVQRAHDLDELLRGARLQWTWVMQNNLGYTDGFQLEFARGQDDGTACIQFIAIASTLELRMVGSPHISGRGGGPEAQVNDSLGLPHRPEPSARPKK